MMKKVASLVISALLICTSAGCYNKSTADNSNVNKGTAQGIENSAHGNYRDGIFTGVGDSNSTGNQTATITIRGGRITNVSLGNIDSQGRPINSSNIGTAQSINNNASQGSRTFSTPGVTTGGIAGGMADNIDDSRTSGNTNMSAESKNNNDNAKGQLENSMISSQTYNVSVTGTNTSIIENWKLAAKRALDRAAY